MDLFFCWSLADSANSGFGSFLFFGNSLTKIASGVARKRNSVSKFGHGRTSSLIFSYPARSIIYPVTGSMTE